MGDSGESEMDAKKNAFRAQCRRAKKLYLV